MQPTRSPDYTQLPESQLADLFVQNSYEACLGNFHGREAEAKTKSEIAQSSRLEAKRRGPAFNSAFARSCASRMNDIDLTHDAVYRAFDDLDLVLGLDYSLDDGMNENHVERIYAGGGIAVQTSYSALLTLFKKLYIPQNASLVDLGSGYGRIGFLLGLIRPDICFTGYEYVDHRVQLCQQIANDTRMSNVKFVTQDLAATDFKLPVVDIYYMYDPFRPETYGLVLRELIEIGRTRSITIITKGRANTWAADALEAAGWKFEPLTDLGAIVTFRSP